MTINSKPWLDLPVNTSEFKIIEFHIQKQIEPSIVLNALAYDEITNSYLLHIVKQIGLELNANPLVTTDTKEETKSFLMLKPYFFNYLIAAFCTIPLFI